MSTMKDILNRMLNHEELSREETKNILLGITRSQFPNEQITALLTALQMRGITSTNYWAFAMAYWRAACQPCSTATDTSTWWALVATVKTPSTYQPPRALSLQVRAIKWPNMAIMLQPRRAAPQTLSSTTA